MEAIKIEIVMKDNSDTEEFITQRIPKLKQEGYEFEHIFWSKCEYFKE